MRVLEFNIMQFFLSVVTFPNDRTRIYVASRNEIHECSGVKFLLV